MDLKLLDPACGSGSFLTRAYDELTHYFEKKYQQANLFTRFRILTGNIYGVDLDAQAVEIAQLNLLLKTLQARTKLPRPEETLCIRTAIS
jgi:type I restriction-modification system DNA methylase subunit